jgi:Protein of unknown function (DUF2800)
MSGAHAFLPPSAAHVWVVCAMWPTMNRLYPETGEKPEAREGAAAHWVMEQFLYERAVEVGQFADNGVPVTQEMIEGADLYQGVVAAAYASIRSVTDYCVEQQVLIPRVHPANRGTPDTWIFGHNPTTGRAQMIVIDYKFGHEFVPVFENWQLINYAFGILDELDADDQTVDVEFIIVQPRNYHRDGPVRRWHVRADAFRAQRNILRYAAEAAHEPKPKATVSPGCIHCPGRHACATLQQAGYAAAAAAQDSTPLEMEPAARGLELKMLERAQMLLDARVSGLKEQVEHDIVTEGGNPHYVMVSTPGRVKWAKPVGEVIALGQMCGADLSRPNVVSPTQAKKLIPPELVDAYSERGAGGRALEQMDTAGARQIFGVAS